MYFPSFDNILFTVGPIFISMIFILVFGMIVFAIIGNIRQWKKNNNSPVLTVEAVVVAKRSDVYHHTNNVDNNMHSSTSTTYYVTFEVESGDRIELRVQGTEYGMLVEHDKGKLTFQGTRYLGFKRE